MGNKSNTTPAIYGVLVQRATATLPQSTDGALFTISGGPVIINAIWGEVTTVIQNQANNTKVKFNPDATGADQDLCAVLDIANDAVGEIYTITGTVADAMVSDLLVGNVMLQDPLLLSEGAIELDCAASNTGSVKWSVIYTPAEIGASVAAA
jgi:hypothetical protein